MNCDGAALDCVLEGQEVLARALRAEEFSGLMREVQNFAFDAALVRCGRLPPALARLAGGAGAAPTRCCMRLETMLAEGDGEALDCALAAQELLERALGAPEAGALLHEVANSDFDAALVRVRSLAAPAGPGAHRVTRNEFRNPKDPSAKPSPSMGGGLGGGDETHPR